MVPRLISVIVPFHNVRRVIDDQLAALMDQDYAGPREFVFADNGSTDGTAEYLRAHPIADSEYPVRVVPADGIQGAAYARNVGALHARGDLLLFADADDVVEKNWLSEMSDVAERFDAVAGELDGAELNSDDVLEWRPTPNIRESFERARFLPSAPGGNLAIWRDTFCAIGGFDESYRPAGEEPDFAWRLQLQGFTLGYAPEAVIHYRLRHSRRALLKQLHAFGIAEARTYSEFRSYGLKRWTPLEMGMAGLYILGRNPLLPQQVTRLNRTRWASEAMFFAGRLRGSMRSWPTKPEPHPDSIRGRLLSEVAGRSVRRRGKRPVGRTA